MEFMVVEHIFYLLYDIIDIIYTVLNYQLLHYTLYFFRLLIYILIYYCIYLNFSKISPTDGRYVIIIQILMHENTKASEFFYWRV